MKRYRSHLTHSKKSLAAIRQLCSLRLDSRFLIPQFLKLLHDYIPSYANVYFWIGMNGDIEDVYDERPDAYKLIPTYFSQYWNNHERDIFDGWSSTLNFGRSVSMDCLWTVDRKRFLRHSFYNEFLGQLSFYWGLHRPIKVGYKIHGILQLHRAKNDQDFAAEDRLKLDQIARHLEYALGLPKQNPDDQTLLPSNTGLIRVDTEGRILSFSPGAEQLFALVHSERSMADSSSISYSRLSPLLKVPVQRLLYAAEGKNTAPPNIAVNNRWGKFRADAYLMLSDQSKEACPHILIRLEHFKPSQILLFEKLEKHLLTDRQTDICINIGLNKQYKQIAAQLGIATSTVISHKKEIFERLQINSRHELVDKLLYS